MFSNFEIAAQQFDGGIPKTVAIQNRPYILNKELGIYYGFIKLPPSVYSSVPSSGVRKLKAMILFITKGCIPCSSDIWQRPYFYPNTIGRWECCAIIGKGSFNPVI